MKIIKMTVLFFFLLALVGSASAIPYSIQNMNGDLKLYINTSGVTTDKIIIDPYNSTPQDPGAVFDVYEDDFENYINISYGAALSRNSTHLDFITPDETGQITHPSIIDFKTPWNGHRYWLAATPYYHHSGLLENPCLYASDDGYTWVVPENITNPLSEAGVNTFNSDVELCYNDTSDELYIYWRYTNSTATTYKLKTFDGETVSNEQVLFSMPDDGVTCDSDKSMSILRVDGVYHWWAMNEDSSSDYVYRNSTNGINWSESAEFIPDNPTSLPVWHLDVQYINSEYVMLMFSGDDLFLASSPNLVDDWIIYPTPILKARSTSGTWDSLLYKSTFCYDETTGKFRMWYGGLDASDNWYIGYTDYPYATLLTALKHMDLCVPRTVAANTSVSNGKLTISADYIGTAQKFSQGNYIITSNISNGTMMFARDMATTATFSGIKMLSTTKVNYYSIVGNGTAFTSSESTVHIDNNAHVFRHYANGSSDVDFANKWTNGDTVSTALSRRLWLSSNIICDKIIVYNGSISTSVPTLEINRSGGNYYSIDTPTSSILEVDGASIGVTNNSQTLNVLPAYLPNFTSVSVSGTAPTSIHFQDNSIGDFDTWYWDFENDGIIDSTKRNPVHTYGKAGTYTVNLTVQNEYGNFSTVKTDYITVSEPAKQSTDYFSSQYFNTIFNTFYRYLFQLPMRLI